MAKVISREITYRTIIEQVFFEDDTELIIKTGWAESQPFDLDIDLEWVNDMPSWAENLTNEQILEKAEK